MATKVGCKCSYEEFEPFCKWVKGACSKSVELNLKDFKKEQMKVVMNNTEGTLSITGERPLEGNKWSRFCKVIKVPDDINTNEIRAKFSCGVLTITMPKKPQFPDEKSATKYLAWFPRLRRVSTRQAVGGIVVVVTVLVLTAIAYGTHKCYKLHCYIEN